MTPDHITVDEIEDDFPAVVYFDKPFIIAKFMNLDDLPEPRELVSQTVDTTLSSVVRWLDTQGHRALAKDLQQAGGI